LSRTYCRLARNVVESLEVVGPHLTANRDGGGAEMIATFVLHQREAVEREFGQLKDEWSLLLVRVRRIERVRLHTDLSILARLGVALA